MWIFGYVFLLTMSFVLQCACLPYLFLLCLTHPPPRSPDSLSWRRARRGNERTAFIRFRLLMLPALVIAAFFLGAVILSLLNTSWPVSSLPPQEPTTAALAGKLFGEGGFILPVEIAAVMLLAAILGAIIIVREK